MPEPAVARRDFSLDIVSGLPIYLVIRPSDTMTEAYDRQLEQEAVLSELQTVSACPNCRRPVQDDFAVCAFRCSWCIWSYPHNFHDWHKHHKHWFY